MIGVVQVVLAHIMRNLLFVIIFFLFVFFAVADLLVAKRTKTNKCPPIFLKESIC